MPDSIGLFGVRTNNLHNISCRIPMDRITVLTGVSGSGKSSLAFDTLYAEGQRRFFEAMSTYSRLFLDQMPKPPVDRVENCLPAIALRQQSSFNHPRSTVASVSEILFQLSQIYANVGTLHCPDCGDTVTSDAESVIFDRLADIGDRLRIVIYADVELIPGESAASRLEALTQMGYQRLWEDGRIVEIASAGVEELLSATRFRVLIDRVVFRRTGGDNARISEAIEEAYHLGGGTLCMDILGEQVQTLVFRKTYSCRTCGRSFSPLRAELFDPNSTIGACETCTGFGQTAGIDWKKVIAPNRSLEDNAIRPFATPSKYQRRSQLLAFCERNRIPTDVPYSALSPEQRQLVKFGKPPYKGVMGFFEYLQSNSNKFINRIAIARYRGYAPCEACEGTGFSAISRHVTVLGRTEHDILSMTLRDARDFFDRVDDAFIERNGIETPFEELRLRLRTLCDVGLGYLTLNRRTKTLSGGESQRLHLGCGLGRGLSDTLYVLDEPSAGLHSRDSLMLVKVMEDLRNLGNTIVVVEHDTDIIAHADNVIELGPGGGELGGNIIYEGNLDGLYDSDTPTGIMMRSEERKSPFRSDRSLPRVGVPIEIVGAYANNLRNIDVTIPTHRLVTIAGVSGSGKSSLVNDVLYAWVQLAHTNDDPGEAVSPEQLEEAITPLCTEIRGLEQFDEIVMMQQQSTGRSARSSIFTVSKAFNAIRELFASQPDAVNNGLSASAFSYNSLQGRCNTCTGLGYNTIEMLFMSDIRQTCPDCGGKRYNSIVRSIRYRGLAISDVIDLSVREAMDFFKDHPSIVSALRPFSEVGLDYVHLGQPSSELSGGEFQRFRLATYLDRPRMANTLFIFDEPTVGLHMQDTRCLLQAMQKIVLAGASIITVEHNLDFIAQSNHVIELGPDAGPDGGAVVFAGTPYQLLQADTLTAQALKRYCSEHR